MILHAGKIKFYKFQCGVPPLIMQFSADDFSIFIWKTRLNVQACDSSYEFALITSGKKSWKRKPYLSRALCAMEAALKWKKQKFSLFEFKPRALFLCLCLGTGQGKSSFQQKDCFHQQIGLKLRKKLTKCYSYIWSIALYGTETWTLRKVDQKYLESFKMWC
jgi:hypothetical protein